MRVVYTNAHNGIYSVTLLRELCQWADVKALFSKRNLQDEVLVLPKVLDGRIVCYEPKTLRHPLVSLGNALQFRSILREFKPDLVHFQDTGPGEELLAMWLFAAKHPRVLTVHDVSPHPGRDSVATSLRSQTTKRILRRSADAIIVHGETLKNDLVGKGYARDPSRVRVVPHPAISPQLAAAATRASTGAVQVLLAGRMEAYKGLSFILEACRRLVARGRDLTLTLAGRGPELERIRDQIIGLPWIVCFDRYIPAAELEGLVAGCDALVMPYIEGSASGLIAFGLGFGKFMVASRVGSFPEYIEDGRSGLLTEPGSVDELERAIDMCFEQPKRVAAIAAGARDAGRGRFSGEAAARATMEIYKSVVDRRRE